MLRNLAKRKRLLPVALTLVGTNPLWGAPLNVSIRTFRDCADCMLMAVLPPGRFMMGSPKNEPGRQTAEGPRHAVTIPKAFAISVYDVTVADYTQFVDATGYAPLNPRCDWRNPAYKGTLLRQTPADPVVCVSWTDANEYLRWLSTRGGNTYRLPTEAEWEYAARAGTTSARYWGPKPDPNRANTGTDTCCAPGVAGADRWLYTSPVGSFPANPFGLYDMIGNVWQWTADCGSENYVLENSARPDPQACETHVVRGGGWFHPPEQARAATRAADQKDLRVADIGFRVARSL